MKTPTHTPTPWLIIEAGQRVVIHPGTMEAGKNNGKRMVCEMHGPDRKENARFLRRAVNSHADMLAALKAIDHSFGRAQSEEVTAQILAAIAKAEGRP